MITIRLMIVLMLSAVAQVHAAADEQKEKNVQLFNALKNGEPLARIKALVEEGADLNARDGIFKATPCHIAVREYRTDCIKILFSKGAYDAKDCIGDTALHEACKRNRQTCVKILLECGANTQEKNNKGETPADLAQEYGFPDIVTLIEEYENISDDIKEPEGN